jgi:ribosomal protein S18 acetylase RimI-like enzyme
MFLRNLFTLKIRVEDFNSAAQKPELLAKLRKLTLHPYSGMNYELNWMLKETLHRKVNCQVLTAFRNRQLVSWALLSKEDTDFSFMNSPNGFRSTDGSMFQVYVHPDYRRQGIASELLKVARRKANGRLCICPHDFGSRKFYANFQNYKAKEL